MESRTIPEGILVTGGAGFIGTHLCRALVKRGHGVVSLDLKGAPPNAVPGVRYVRGDARDRETVASLLRAHGISTVYHLAATVSVPLCQDDPLDSYSHNLMATLAVLDACRKNESPVRVAFASSAALYGDLGNDRAPLSEERIAERYSSFYAAQKHASEKAIELYCGFFGIAALIFRFFNVYGEGQDPQSPYSGVITIFSRLAKEKLPLTLYNSGVQTRDFVAVTDLVEGLVSALALPPEEWDAGVFNLGSGRSTSVRDLAELLRALLGSDSPIVEAPPRAADVLHSLADIARAKNKLGFQPAGELETKLSECLGLEKNPGANQFATGGMSLSPAGVP